LYNFAVYERGTPDCFELSAKEEFRQLATEFNAKADFSSKQWTDNCSTEIDLQSGFMRARPCRVVHLKPTTTVHDWRVARQNSKNGLTGHAAAKCTSGQFYGAVEVRVGPQIVATTP
jgi:hypothetical protein